MYDVGLRVGQALGLRHVDLDPMRRPVRVIRRSDNANGALSKQRDEFTLDAPRRFFDLYAEYLLEELPAVGVDSDYVFVNLSRRPVGKPLTYSNAQQLVTRIGASAGIERLHPHTLRHTAASLAIQGGANIKALQNMLVHESAGLTLDRYGHLYESDVEGVGIAINQLLTRDCGQNVVTGGRSGVPFGTPASL